MRVVRTPAGVVEIDLTGRANGRGAYLCNDAACWAVAAAKPVLERALDTRLDPTTRARLAAGPGGPAATDTTIHDPDQPRGGAHGTK